MRIGEGNRDSLRLARIGAIGVGLAVAMAAGGCGEGDREPTGTNTKKTTEQTDQSTPTDAANTTAPTEPETADPTPLPDRLPEAEPPTDPYERELYDATVEFYGAILEAYRTLDLATAEGRVTPDSGALSGYADYIESVNAQGHTFDQLPEFVVTDFKWKQDSADATEEVRFRLYASGLREVDANGDEVATIDESWSNVKILFAKQEEQWLVAIQDVK